MADMKTPLNRVRGLGSAKEGTDHFWVQRLTAVANIPLVIFFAFSIVSLSGAPYADVTAYFGNPIVTVLMLLVVLSVVWHMRLGMQVVIEDYVHSELTKFALMMGNTFFCIFVGLASAVALLKISFGG
ncbi:MAG: succinate dehydrogenase, hydrophobic membrane anchor protein [Pseudomonadota bacterium]